MRARHIIFAAALLLAVAACSDDDAALSTTSTLITGGGGTSAPEETTTTSDASGNGGTPTTLVGEAVSGFTVVDEIANDDGFEKRIVIPQGAYTDVDLQNFVLELLESDPDLYGAEIFDSEEAAAAFAVEEADRTPEQTELLERHHFVTVIGRDSIEFRGPFSEFPGGAIGS